MGKKQTARDAAEKAAQKYADKVTDCHSSKDWIKSDFLAGVAWARRQGRRGRK